MHQFINGKLLPGTSGNNFDVINPATSEVVETVGLASLTDLESAVAAARAAYPAAWSRTAPGERSGILQRFARIMEERSGDFSRVESSQTGKPLRLTREFDVPGTIDNFDFFAGAARHLEGKTTAEYSPQHTSSVRREAIGVVGSIALELSPADGRVEDPSGHRRGQHGCAQACRDHAANFAPVRPEAFGIGFDS